MNWSFLLFGFAIAVATGAIAATMLARIRPQWTERRRLVVAASILPALTLAAGGLVIVSLLVSGAGGDMRGLAIAALATGSAASAATALVGGVIGALLRQRGMRR